MKKHSAEEASKLAFYKAGRTTYVRFTLMTLEIGEAITIEKGIDWVSKTPPYGVIRYYAKQSKKKFLYGRATDGKGWIVKRIA